MEQNNIQPEEKKKSARMYIPLIIIILIVLTGGLYWYAEYSRYISTDDAYIDSDKVSISSKMLSRIIQLYAGEGDSVKQGQLLAELDSLDILAQKSQFVAVRNQARAILNQSQAKYNYDQESIKVLEINVEKTQDDYTRSANQLSSNAITKEKYDHDKKAFESAQAQLEAAKTQLTVSKAQIATAVAAVQSADAQIDVLTTQLNITRLYAPMDGIIAKRWLLPGDIAQPGQSIFTITNTGSLWVNVYIEETKMADIHLNQKALFTVDAYDGATFKGKIISIGSNTASQFSLIPPNNASGNFTKVTQRVPLKISIEGCDTQRDLTGINLLAGMSVVMKIIKD
jgi:membrane fusion protein, multidrug efflux system